MWTWKILVKIVSAYFLKIWLLKKHQDCKRVLPPGPRRLPIIGNLHLPNLLIQGFKSLLKQYGPIMYMRLVFVPVVVISSPQAAKQILKTHDHVFASRPYRESSKFFSYNRKNIYFSYGPYWRKMRKLCTLELLWYAKINSFKQTRKEEVAILIDDIKKADSARVAVDVTSQTASLVADMTCRIVFGRKFMDNEIDERGIKAVIEEMVELGAATNISDFFPQLAL